MSGQGQWDIWRLNAWVNQPQGLSSKNTKTIFLKFIHLTLVLSPLMMGTGSRESTCSFQQEIFAKLSLTWTEQLRQERTVWLRFLLLQPRFAHPEGWTLCWVKAFVHLHLLSSVLNSLWRGKRLCFSGSRCLIILPLSFFIKLIPGSPL